MNPHSNAVSSWSQLNFGAGVVDESATQIDGRYSGYGVVVQSDPSLDAIALEPYSSCTRNSFLTSIGEVRGSLAAARRQPDATGRFFRVGIALCGKVLFITSELNGFRLIDMDSMAIKEIDEDGMWMLLKDCHAVGGLHPLMPARMPI